MSNPIQWLLIGGPLHGTTPTIKAGHFVRAPDGTVYIGQNWLENGRLYRVGFSDSKDVESAVVRELIKRLKPVHIAGS